MVLVSLVVGAIDACRPSPSPAADLDITGGRKVGAFSHLPTRRSTLALTQPDLLAEGLSFCTAVLIGPNVALTAAHCVTDDEGVPLDPKGFVVGAGPTLKTSQKNAVPVLATAVHRRWRPGALELGEWTDFNDLALIRLASIPSNTRPIELMDPLKPVKKGERLTLAGYGVTHTRSEDDTGVLRSVLVRVTELDDDIHIFTTEGAKRKNVVLESRPFDGHRRLYPLHAGACAGDSGGPAYRRRKDGKTWELVGITSYGTELTGVAGSPGEDYCTGSNGYTNLSPYVSYLKKVLTDLHQQDPCPGTTFEFDEDGLKSLTSGTCSGQSQVQQLSSRRS